MASSRSSSSSSYSSFPRTKGAAAMAVVTIVAAMVLSAEAEMGVGKGPTGGALAYHGGPLLTGTVNLSVLFYGQIGRVQKNAIRAFIKSLNAESVSQQPSVAAWWNVVESYQAAAEKEKEAPKRIEVKVGRVATDARYSAGKIMTADFVRTLVEKATGGRADGSTLAVIVTDRQVTVQDMCTGRCSQHGAFGKQAYVVVGNPETECPDACAWPFHHNSGHPGVILQPPSGNLGADVMVMSLASALADAVTNPFGSGFFLPGPRHVGPLGASTACKGIFGSGAFPGYTGKVRVDPSTGGAFNSHGLNANKFLLPAVWNPATSSCWTPL